MDPGLNPGPTGGPSVRPKGSFTLVVPGVSGPFATPRGRARLVAAGALSLVAWILLQWVAPPATIPWMEEMRRGAEFMAAALEATGRHCRESGIPMDPAIDPTGTCLLGPDYTELFTTLGSLEAKRTTLTPDLAGLLVHLLAEGGVGAGDGVAVGASGSFPGLLVATLAAVRALEAEPLTILSLGASSHGATRPGFTILDLHRVLEMEGLVPGPPAAVSLGGGGDVGRGMDPDFVQALESSLAGGKAPLILEDDLPGNVSRRMEIYGDPVLFVNIGGATANLGISPAILEVGPGLHPGGGLDAVLPPAPERGVLFAMAARGIPVVHLLNLRGLALRHGLPWDPVVRIPPGTTSLQRGTPSRGGPFWFLTGAYLLSLLLLLLPRHGAREGPRP